MLRTKPNVAFKHTSLCMLKPFQVEAVVREYTFTQLNLHDGSYYDIKLVVCNAAKLCSESELRNVLFDSTPPTVGKTQSCKNDYA